jgi:chromosome segregation ATPase
MFHFFLLLSVINKKKKEQMNELTRIREKLNQHNTSLRSRSETNTQIIQHYKELLDELTQDMNQAKLQSQDLTKQRLQLQEQRDRLTKELAACTNDDCKSKTQTQINTFIQQGDQVAAELTRVTDRFNYNQTKLARLQLVYDQLKDQNNAYIDQHQSLQTIYEDTTSLLELITTLTNDAPIDKQNLANAKSQYYTLEQRIKQLTQELHQVHKERESTIKKLTDEYQASNLSKDSTIKKLIEDKEVTLRKILTDKESSIAKLIDDKDSSVKRILAEKDANEKAWKAKEADWEKRWNELNTQYQQVEQRVGFAHDISTSCVAKNGAFLKHIHSLAEQVKAIRADEPMLVPITETISRLEELRAKLTDPTSPVKSTKPETTKITQVIVQLTNEKKEMESQLKEAKRELETLTKRLVSHSDPTKYQLLESEYNMKKAMFENQSLELERLKTMATDNQKLKEASMTCETVTKQLQAEVAKQLETAKVLAAERSQLENELQEYKQKIKHCKSADNVEQMNQEILAIRDELDSCHKKSASQAQHVLNLEQRQQVAESRQDQLEKALALNKQLEERIIASQKQHNILVADYQAIKDKRALEGEQLQIFRKYQDRFLSNEKETDQLQNKIKELESQVNKKEPELVNKLNDAVVLIEKQLKDTGKLLDSQLPKRFPKETDRQWAREQMKHIVTQTLLQLRSAKELGIHDLELNPTKASTIIQTTIDACTLKYNDARERINSLMLPPQPKQIRDQQDKLAAKLKAPEATTENGLKPIVKELRQSQDQIKELIHAKDPPKDIDELKDRHNSLLTQVDLIQKTQDIAPAAQVKENLDTKAPAIVIQLDNEAEDDELINQITRDRLDKINAQVKDESIQLRNQRDRIIHLQELYDSSLQRSTRLLQTSGLKEPLNVKDLADAQRNGQTALQKRLESLEKSITNNKPKVDVTAPIKDDDEQTAIRNFQRHVTIHTVPHVLTVVVGMDSNVVMAKIINLISQHKTLLEKTLQIPLKQFSLYEGQNRTYDSDTITTIEDTYKACHLLAVATKDYLIHLQFGSPYLPNHIHFYIMNWVVKDFSSSNIQNLYQDSRIKGCGLSAHLSTSAFTQFLNLCLPPIDTKNKLHLDKKLAIFASDLNTLESLSMLQNKTFADAPPQN